MLPRAAGLASPLALAVAIALLPACADRNATGPGHVPVVLDLVATTLAPGVVAISGSVINVGGGRVYYDAVCWNPLDIRIQDPDSRARNVCLDCSDALCTMCPGRIRTLDPGEVARQRESFEGNLVDCDGPFAARAGRYVATATFRGHTGEGRAFALTHSIAFAYDPAR